MTYLNNVQEDFAAWMNALSAADNAIIAAIGFGLMIFAVAALLIQKFLENPKRLATGRQVLQPRKQPLPGQRFSPSYAAYAKSGLLVRRTKIDPFLSRLRRLA